MRSAAFPLLPLLARPATGELRSWARLALRLCRRCRPCAARRRNRFGRWWQYSASTRALRTPLPDWLVAALSALSTLSAVVGALSMILLIDSPRCPIAALPPTCSRGSLRWLLVSERISAEQAGAVRALCTARRRVTDPYLHEPAPGR